MSKRQKKKAPAVEEVPAAEVETRIEYIYEDTQCVTGVEPEYKWGDVYRMISRREVLDMGLEEAPIYANIEKSAIMKVATRPELFPCSELMRWCYHIQTTIQCSSVTSMARAMLHLALVM